MRRYVRIKILADGIRVRFEKVDPPDKTGEFDRLRDAFYSSIPAAKWNQKKRWMVVPLSDIGRVLDFSYRHFGVGHVRMQLDNQVTPMLKQLSMNF